MRLETDLLREVITTLDARQDDPANLGKRQTVRYRVSQKIQIRPYGVTHATPRMVQLTDISVGGICVMDQMNLSAGDRFVAHLPRSNGQYEAVLCTVRQSRLSLEGGFRVGAEFSHGFDANMRLISGAEGMVAAVTGGGSNAIKVSFPAEGSNGTFHAAGIQKASTESFVLITTHSADPGDPIYLHFGQEEQPGRQLHCIVMETKLLESGQFRLVTQLAPQAHTQAQPAGILGWIRRAWTK